MKTKKQKDRKIKINEKDRYRQIDIDTQIYIDRYR